MDNNIIFVKQNDTARILTDTLLLSDGTPINLTNATLKFIVNGVKKDCEIVSASIGAVQYRFDDTDLENAGSLKCEWEITFESGLQLSVPTKGYIIVRIVPDLA
jgi:hypothetical protein